MPREMKKKNLLDDAHNPELLDDLIQLLKCNLQTKHQAALPNDLGILYGLYERLIERHRMIANEDIVADAVLYFLNEENKNGADMQLAKLEVERDIFTPCEDMATTITEILKERGECAPSDLEKKGFSPSNIKSHWAMSYALAKVELNWMGV